MLATSFKKVKKENSIFLNVLCDCVLSVSVKVIIKTESEKVAHDVIP